MRIKKMIIFMFFIIVLIGCEKNVNQNFDYELIFSDKKSTNNYALIYEYKDGRKIYSEFSNIKFKKNDNISNLALAFDKNIITIDDIIAKLDYKMEANDGGSKIYSYTKKGNDFSNVDFMIIECKTLNGNRDIIIGSSENIINKCNE